jgi:hypothetical protein
MIVVEDLAEQGPERDGGREDTLAEVVPQSGGGIMDELGREAIGEG